MRLIVHPFVPAAELDGPLSHQKHETSRKGNCIIGLLTKFVPFHDYLVSFNVLLGQHHTSSPNQLPWCPLIEKSLLCELMHCWKQRWVLFSVFFICQSRILNLLCKESLNVAFSGALQHADPFFSPQLVPRIVAGIAK